MGKSCPCDLLCVSFLNISKLVCVFVCVFFFFFFFFFILVFKGGIRDLIVLRFFLHQCLFFVCVFVFVIF